MAIIKTQKKVFGFQICIFNNLKVSGHLCRYVLSEQILNWLPKGSKRILRFLIKLRGLRFVILINRKRSYISAMTSHKLRKYTELVLLKIALEKLTTSKTCAYYNSQKFRFN